MSKKPKILAAMLFMYVSLICVGFASWTISNGSSGNNSIDGSIVVDNVINTSDVLVMTNNTRMFDYYNSGFVENDGTITLEGSIYLEYTLAIDKCKDVFKENTNLVIYVDLKHPSDVLNSNSTFEGFFSSDKNAPIQSEAALESNVGSPAFNYIAGKSVITFSDFKNIPEESVTIKITIIFTVTDDASHTYFKESIYPFLKNNDKCFAVTTKLTGTGA